MLTNYGHLTYCTNIHAGETWEDHFAAIRENFPSIKKSISPHHPMGLGLRLSNVASLELVKEAALNEFMEWLRETGAYVFTMNGFPYGGFHHVKVKDQVHAPDWTSPDRVAYTIRLFRILARLLPASMDGGISTSPLSYRHWFKDEHEKADATNTATSNILTVVEELVSLHTTTGKLLHLDIEPEPDGLLESGAEFITWYEKVLLPMGKNSLPGKLGITVTEAEALIKTHVRLCYDVCHFAIGYEPHEEMMASLQEKGILIGKIQISAALKTNMQGDAAHRELTKHAFESFNENTYLHQVIAKTTRGGLVRYRDLPEALADFQNEMVTEWRAHYHVPVSLEEYGLLQSTQADIVRVLDFHAKSPQTNHLEVETYTWEVLPDSLKSPIQESISNELQWVKNNLFIVN